MRKDNDRLTLPQAILGTICILLFFFVMGIVGYFETHYRMNGEVVEVNKGFAVVEDIMGQQWMFEGDGYELHDKVIIKFDNNFTDGTRLDDIVTDVKAIVK